MSYEQKIDDPVASEAEAGRINWDDSAITSSYANIATATATREEFFLLFGIHQNWKGMPVDGQLEVKLTQRVVLNPYAAKRLTKLLERSIAVYEERFGPSHI